jgi:hypothetical protein
MAAGCWLLCAGAVSLLLDNLPPSLAPCRSSHAQPGGNASRGAADADADGNAQPSPPCNCPAPRAASDPAAGRWVCVRALGRRRCRRRRACRLQYVGCSVLAAGCWLLAAGCWLLAAGCCALVLVLSGAARRALTWAMPRKHLLKVEPHPAGAIQAAGQCGSLTLVHGWSGKHGFTSELQFIRAAKGYTWAVASPGCSGRRM